MGLPGGWSKGTRGDWSADGDVGAEARQKVGTEERSREGPKSKLLAFMRIGCGDSGLSGATFPVLVAAGGAEPWPLELFEFTVILLQFVILELCHCNFTIH